MQWSTVTPVLVLIVSIVVGILIAVLYYNAKKDQSNPQQQSELRANTAVIVLSFTVVGAIISLIVQGMTSPDPAVCPPPPKCNARISETDIVNARAAAETLSAYNKKLQDLPKVDLEKGPCAANGAKPDNLTVKTCDTCPGSTIPQPPPPPAPPAVPAKSDVAKALEAKFKK